MSKLCFPSVAPDSYEEWKVSWVRYFIETSWVSLTAGFLLFLYTWVLQWPHGWAVALLLMRALLHSFFYPAHLNLIVRSGSVTGPTMFMGGKETINYDTVSEVSVRKGRFFLETEDGKLITGRIRWYRVEDRTHLLKWLQWLRDATRVEKRGSGDEQLLRGGRANLWDQV